MESLVEDVDTPEDGEGDAGDGAAPGGDAPAVDAAPAPLVAPAVDDAASDAATDTTQSATGESAPKTETAPADLPTWDGQVASLDKQEWWAKLPEDARPSVTTGLKGILTGWQRTYNGKLEEAAGQRKTLETERAALEANKAALVELEGNWLKLVSGEAEDPIKTRDGKIADLTAALEEAKKGATGKVAEDAQAAVAKAKGLWDREKTDLSTRAETAETTLSQFTSEIEAAYREHLSEWLATNASDLADDGKEPALQLWLELHAKGNALAESLQMVRAKYPAPVVASAPAPAPDAIALMSMGDRTTKRDLGAGGQDVWEQIRRKTTEIAPWPSR